MRAAREWWRITVGKGLVFSDGASEIFGSGRVTVTWYMTIITFDLTQKAHQQMCDSLPIHFVTRQEGFDGPLSCVCIPER